MLGSQGGPTVAVVGAGNGGLAFAACMALQGAAVRLCDAVPAAIAPLAERRISLERDGRCEEARVERVTTDLREAVAGARLVMMVVPASAHAAVAAAIAPHLEPDAVIVLNPGRTGGALEIRKILCDRGVSTKVTVAEAQTLLFACRKQGGTRVVVNGTKRTVPLAALPQERTGLALEALNRFFPQFTAASSVLETSLGNMGAIFHPAPTLLNTARIEGTAGSFQYYVDGISRSVAGLLERADGERMSVARALGVPAVSALRWIEQAYGLGPCASLYEAIQGNSAYRGIMAPSSIDVRYVTEDVPTGLVPLASIARHVHVPTPVIDTIVDLACQLLARDFWTEGRNVTKLGLEEAFPGVIRRGARP